VNFSKISKTVLPALALLLATSAFAANKQNKGSIELDKPATIGGHQLAPGEYKLAWDGTGPNVDLMIKSYGKLVATVPAHLIELSRPEPSNGYEVHTNDDGSQILTSIEFGGKKYELSFCRAGDDARNSVAEQQPVILNPLQSGSSANNGTGRCLRLVEIHHSATIPA
jgi:hypothetical protein